jgi:NADH-quinone oxidoreductase subunit L
VKPEYLYLILLAPAAGFVVNGLLGRRLGRVGVSLVGCGTLAASFVMSALLLFGHAETGAAHVLQYRWIEAGPLSVPVAFTLDGLTLVMLMVVTGVGLLIHVYSTGYMHDDPSYQRFFSYLNLFVFFMLVLVTADNLALMFVGWEGVGLCSYLLIGYDYQRPAAAAAGLKAFLVNRVGDAGFILAMLVAFHTWGSLSVGQIVSGAEASAGSGELLAVKLVALLLFFAATGKSAQIPLYVWLPDAMEGPTPVSALIHAATMVTSGVYLAARLGSLYGLVPGVLEVVMLVGGLTAFVAATMGVVERDMKRVLAYSTISQLGYMFLGVGAGAAFAGMFHLTTHAFFKACLFLCAGSVMHALHGELDLFKMGRLRGKLPLTWLSMLAATLAIVGFPLTSGFVSKDGILWQAYQATGLMGRIGFVCGVVTVALTSFYMFRLYFLAFHGSPRDEQRHAAAHESPMSMTAVLVILGLLSIGGGLLNWPASLGGHQSFRQFIAAQGQGPDSHGEAEHAAASEAEIEPAAASHGPSAHHDPAEIRAERIFSVAIVLVGVLGFIPAWRRYGNADRSLLEPSKPPGALHRFLLEKWYVDHIYGSVFVKGTIGISRFLWRWIDDVLIDGSVNLIGFAAGLSGELLRMFQTGLTRNYALVLFLGAIAVLLYLVL